MAMFRPKPIAAKPIAAKPVMGNPVMPGIKTLVNATAPVGNIASRLTGGPAPSQPVMGNKINTTGFKNMSPATLQSGMKKGGMTASSRADGIAAKGKTRGRMV